MPFKLIVIFFYSQMPWFVMTQSVIHDKSRDFFSYFLFVFSYRDKQAELLKGIS